MSIPVIDLFAGPGGLGEGFMRDRSLGFTIAISIEKDAMAHQTLRLRAAHRALQDLVSSSSKSWIRWDTIVEEASWEDAFEALIGCDDPQISQACLHAQQEALNLELGPLSRTVASQAIKSRLVSVTGRQRLPHNSVLIGGPPCQAYSIVGRSRNRGTASYSPERDHRHFLYLEYLHVISQFRPAVFVMENVKGILSSRVKEQQIFQTILRDLRRPDLATESRNRLEYVVVPLPGSRGTLLNPIPDDFIVKAEEYGVPQARHRVILLGIRKDVWDAAGASLDMLIAQRPPTVLDVIGDLPALRPELSYRGNGQTWLGAFDSPLFDTTVNQIRLTGSEQGFAIAKRLELVRAKLFARQSDPGSGDDRLLLKGPQRDRRPRRLSAWFKDRPSDLLANHKSRAHMPSDLVRYLFVAAFGEETGQSPRLHDFPRCLLPEHKNVDPDNIGDSIFKDRFRVQVGDSHSMTVTSHIAKDGHAFIHPKPGQCRSLTVREAARLQTFPDSYVFLGSRTSQYTQVGNAVPPFLAAQIARIVANVLRRAGLQESPLHGTRESSAIVAAA